MRCLRKCLHSRDAMAVVRGLAFGLLMLASGPALAAVDIQWWHAMPGELGRQVEKLAADFNATQSEYRVVPTYKGSYSETVTAAIFAFRSRGQPAIVQVNEIATATMMAAKGATYPVYELMRDAREPFSPDAFLPAITGYYTDADGNMLSFPFNTSAPILYYNKALFRSAGLDPDQAPKTWPEVGMAAERLRSSGVPCGFTTHWPSWITVETFSAMHDVPVATRGNGMQGLDAELTIDNPLMVRHIGQLAAWAKSKIYDYSGRGTSAEPRFVRGECGIFIGSSALRAQFIKAPFEVGFGPLPYWPDVPQAPRNPLIGGATLWVLKDRPTDEYRGVARFFAYLSRPEVQAAWHQATGYLPVTRAAYELTRSQGFYDRHPGAAIAIEEMMAKPPTGNSRGLRLGSFILIRDVIEDQLEQAISGAKTPQAALHDAVVQGNRMLRQFERANP